MQHKKLVKDVTRAWQTSEMIRGVVQALHYSFDDEGIREGVSEAFVIDNIGHLWDLCHINYLTLSTLEEALSRESDCGGIIGHPSAEALQDHE